MDSLEELFCHIDDFCQQFEPKWHSLLLGEGVQHRQRQRSLSLSEIMTILVCFHQQHYRNVKTFYNKHVCVHWREAFPGLVSYNRFVEWMPSALMPLCVYLKHCFGGCTGISFIDSSSLKVCHNRRIRRHKVFRGLAARGKTSVDWFFGFKLHLVVNERGELLNIQITPGNTDDRKPVEDLLEGLYGKVFADRGYVSKALAQRLFETYGIEFFAKPKRNMKNHLMRLTDKLLARKRAIIETVIDQLKNISQIEHSRHRSPTNFMVNVICGLIAYCHQPKKPSLNLDFALPPSA
ncbi:IS982 family transposase [Nodosilinea sp. LEGE 07088]|uniref:IS982 family transposase n=1 Tax=Nodosilinea sp. LEGE 07088 TaxID=2777968 RepID=UPI001882441E|nr:IS982 family transposase [Nodosilinea sp. LEGE 07088]MBE9140921.1 IS982 family transposase [Nodosilinea sp. LEGE 07088]